MSGNLIKQKLFFIDGCWTFINHGAFGGSIKPFVREANEWRQVCLKFAFVCTTVIILVFRISMLKPSR